MDEINEANFEIIFDGPVDDSADTMRRLKASFLADLELDVSTIQKILSITGVTVYETASETEAQLVLSKLKAAGGKVTLQRGGTKTESIEVALEDNKVEDDGIAFELDIDEIEEFTEQPKPKPETKSPKSYTLELDEDLDKVLSVTDDEIGQVASQQPDIEDDVEELLKQLKEPANFKLQTDIASDELSLAEPITELPLIDSNVVPQEEEQEEILDESLTPNEIIAKVAEELDEDDLTLGDEEEALESSFSISGEDDEDSDDDIDLSLGPDELIKGKKEAKTTAVTESVTVTESAQPASKPSKQGNLELNATSLSLDDELQQEEQESSAAKVEAAPAPNIKSVNESEPTLETFGEESEEVVAAAPQALRQEELRSPPEESGSLQNGSIAKGIANKNKSDVPNIDELNMSRAPSSGKRSSFKNNRSPGSQLIVPAVGIGGLTLLVVVNMFFFSKPGDQEAQIMQQQITRSIEIQEANRRMKLKKDQEVESVDKILYTGKASSKEFTLNSKCLVEVGGLIAHCKLSLKTPPPKNLTPAEIVDGVLAPPWLKKFETAGVALDVKEGAALKGQGVGRVYIRYDDKVSRLKGLVEVSLIRAPKDSVSSLRIVVKSTTPVESQKPAKDDLIHIEPDSTGQHRFQISLVMPVEGEKFVE